MRASRGKQMSRADFPDRRRFLLSTALGTAGVIVSVRDNETAPAHGAQPPAVTANSKQGLNDFLELSRDLTGYSNLDPGLGLEYLDRFRETFGRNILNDLIHEHKTIYA